MAAIPFAVVDDMYLDAYYAWNYGQPGSDRTEVHPDLAMALDTGWTGYGAIVYAQFTESAVVPLPAAGWLFITALVGLVGKKRLSRR